MSFHNDYEVQLLFPVSIFRTNIGTLGEEQYKFVKEKSYTERTTGTHGRDQTDVLEMEIFSDLKQKILSAVQFYSSEIYKHKTTVYLTHSWINHNPSGSYHNMHTHSNSIFSGVYYINHPSDTPNLNLYNPKRSFPLEILPSESNEVNCNMWELPVGCGDLVIFPSMLPHEVSKNHGNDDRYTLAFNTFIQGHIGEKGSDNYLRL